MEKKKILIIDDEQEVLGLLEKRLSWAGYSVVKADNGIEALALAKSQNPDLIILDIMLPGMGGEEVGQKLKLNPDTKHIPIIFLTCLVSRDEQTIIDSNAGNSIIAKPYEADELLSEIKKHLQS
ncbi:MAG: response regulator [Candidatus Omnitrophota bacterium]